MFNLIIAIATLLLPCAEEDSINCTWYGDVQGNGIGATQTFYTGPINEYGTDTYVYVWGE